LESREIILAQETQFSDIKLEKSYGFASNSCLIRQEPMSAFKHYRRGREKVPFEVNIFFF